MLPQQSTNNQVIEAPFSVKSSPTLQAFYKKEAPSETNKYEWENWFWSAVNIWFKVF